MPHPITTLTALLTLALAAAPALAQGAPATTPEFLPNTASSAPFSRAVQVGDTLYLAGQLGLPRRITETEETGIEAETRRAMERIGETLALYGLTHDALFKCTVWLADIDDFGAFNAVYAKFFQEGRYPVRSTMAVKDLAAGAKIEIECTAHNPRIGSQPTIPWGMALEHLRSGAARKTGVYTRKEASQCVGRWRLHADALDDGAFPATAMESFPPELGLGNAIASAEFFRLDVMADGLVREASDEAEKQLRKALQGDAQALQTYFEALGECSATAEAASDECDGGDIEGPAG
ncbi:RidA family protein [Qipengyuania sp. S6317L1]|uniref:RidA family protein n=1 Tax=Qipengyuania sp. S6317L1 TaxID=2926410 RepID=UPI001FF69F9E|nr:RidA family protein [Qipengyuania sp. S6317L1]MCK0098382.1 RidA family protein [Qipengyuania sp. S6317L1]